MIAFKLVFDEGELYGAGVSGFFFFGWAGCFWGKVFSLTLNKCFPFWQTMLLPWRPLDTINAASSSSGEYGLGLCVGGCGSRGRSRCVESVQGNCFTVEQRRERPYFPSLVSYYFLSEEDPTLLRIWEVSLSPCFSSFTPFVSTSCDLVFFPHILLRLAFFSAVVFASLHVDVYLVHLL